MFNVYCNILCFLMETVKAKECLKRKIDDGKMSQTTFKLSLHVVVELSKQIYLTNSFSRLMKGKLVFHFVEVEEF